MIHRTAFAVTTFSLMLAGQSFAQPGRTFTPPPAFTPPPVFTPPRVYTPPPVYTPPSIPQPNYSPSQTPAYQISQQMQEMNRQSNERDRMRMQMEADSMRRMLDRNGGGGGGGAGGIGGVGIVIPAPAPKPQIQFGIAFKEINPGSQAEKLGLQSGDMLVQYDGVDVASIDHFVSMRKEEAADGPAREIVVVRGDDRLTFKVKSGPIGAVLYVR